MPKCARSRRFEGELLRWLAISPWAEQIPDLLRRLRQRPGGAAQPGFLIHGGLDDLPRTILRVPWCGSEDAEWQTGRYAHGLDKLGRAGGQGPEATHGVAHARGPMGGRTRSTRSAGRQQWLAAPLQACLIGWPSHWPRYSRAWPVGPARAPDIPRPLAPPPRPWPGPVRSGHGNQGLGRWSPPAPSAP